MQLQRYKWFISIFLLLFGITIGLFLATQLKRTETLTGQERQTRGKPPRSAVSVPEEVQAAEIISRALVWTAQRVVPAVVSIHSVKILTELPSDDFSLRENKGQKGRNFRFSIPKQYRQEGTGSGVLISSDGYIVTNYHVVNQAQEIEVTLYDQRSFPARVIGTDRLSEVAVIKIDGTGFPFARLGNSDSCKVGQLVLAVGNPLDLSSTVTAGIISALGRQIDIINDNFAVETFIQTDAAINPGNSGGALVNLRGEVIGINTAIATETGYDMGFGFAIPINLVKKISADLIRNGKVIRGYLGIAMQAITELHVRALNLKRPVGVFVDDVFRNSPAEKSDIRPMDVILAVDGIEITRPNQLQAYIAKKSPGAEIFLKIQRDDRTVHRRVILGAREDRPARKHRSHRPPQKFNYLGIKVKPLTEFDRIELGYSGTKGVLISEIERYSPAEKAGLQIDDIIVAVNRVPVQNIVDFGRLLKDLQPGDVVIIKVFRASGYFHYFIRNP